MALKKAEMEDHAERYRAQMQVVREAEENGMYKVAIQQAIAAWQYIDGMLQYAKRYEEKEFQSVPAVDLVLHYAPLLLDRKSLAAVEGFLETCKRIHRQTSEDIPAKVEEASRHLSANHRLWSHIESKGEVRQDRLREQLGGDQEYWRRVSQAWGKIGLLSRTPDAGSYRLKLSTRMGEVVRGKCPACGHVDQAPKGMFLERTTCPTCKKEVLFVFLARTAAPEGTE